MLKNYLITAYRTIIRYKIIFLINIAGLSLGMACFVLIFLFIQDEFSYDRHHEKSDQIYRVVGDLDRNKISPESSAIGPPMAWAMLEDVPAIINVVRIEPAQSNQVLVQYQNKRFHEKGVGFADASIFKIFSFPLIQGDPISSLVEPYTIVISQAMAAKYFGDENPVGKTLTFENEFEYRITGVMKNMPTNSHFHFDFLGSFESLKREYRGMYDCWWCKMAHTYVLLPEHYPPNEVERQFPAFLEKHIGLQNETGIRLRLQSLTDIHLYSALTAEIEPRTDIVFIYILATIGLAILLIACFNYMNLTTAVFGQRSKEVGIRKVFGANGKQLKAQFLSEAVIVAFIALGIAVFLVELAIPTFNLIVDKTLGIEYFQNWMILFLLGILAIFVGLFSGSYPVVVLSRFQPAMVLKSKMSLGARASTFRNALVVSQFICSIVLIITSTIIHQQLEYIRDKKLGFDKEHIVTLPILDNKIYNEYESFKNNLLQNGRIINVSAASQVPTEELYDLDVWPGDTRETGKQKMKIAIVHYDYFETLNLEVVEGRTFSKKYVTDVKRGFILNESAVSALGWQPESAVGKTFGAAWHDKQGKIIGVVKDFHFESLHQKIEPVAFFIEPWYNHVVVKMSSENITETLAHMKKTWQKYMPNRPFEYAFLDVKVDALYRKEEKTSQIVSYFSTLILFIAFLGLFGLSAFAVERWLKEAGIRKVLGASILNIVALVSQEFVKLAAFANIIAWPVAYFCLNKWLQGFAYRVNIEPQVFIFSGLAALFMALLAVSYYTLKVALTNPVKVLRYE